MTALVFVDTNVLVYARDAGEPGKQPRAITWLDHLWREALGRTSMQVLSEYYVTVTRKLAPGLPPEEAWDDVSALLAWNPQPVDRDVLTGGHEIERRYRLSWWDSLVVAAAQVQGCAILLSEDLQDGASFAGVTVRNPFAFGVEQARASFDVGSNTRARRAGRGGRAVRPG